MSQKDASRHPVQPISETIRIKNTRLLGLGNRFEAEGVVVLENLIHVGGAQEAHDFHDRKNESHRKGEFEIDQEREREEHLPA